MYAYGLAAPRYFAVSDVIYLQQSDLVFELNGKPVRAWGELLTTHHEKFALEDTIQEILGDFIPRNIQDFLTDLVLGNGPDTRAIPSGTQSSSGGAAPKAPTSGGLGGTSKSSASTSPAPTPAVPAAERCWPPKKASPGFDHGRQGRCIAPRRIAVGRHA